MCRSRERIEKKTHIENLKKKASEFGCVWPLDEFLLNEIAFSSPLTVICFGCFSEVFWWADIFRFVLCFIHYFMIFNTGQRSDRVILKAWCDLSVAGTHTERERYARQRQRPRSYTGKRNALISWEKPNHKSSKDWIGTDISRFFFFFYYYCAALRLTFFIHWNCVR